MKKMDLGLWDVIWLIVFILNIIEVTITNFFSAYSFLSLIAIFVVLNHRESIELNIISAKFIALSAVVFIVSCAIPGMFDWFLIGPKSFGILACSLFSLCFGFGEDMRNLPHSSYGRSSQSNHEPSYQNNFLSNTQAYKPPINQPGGLINMTTNQGFSQEPR